jgi:tetratricopeptide (TPR) repeat protein
VAITVLLPFLLLAGLEGALRLAGYGETLPLFEPVPDFPAYRRQNPQVARRYFARLAEVPTGFEDVFEAEKRAGTFRIFVQGGSSALGFPYYYGGSFSRMLEQRLQATFPVRNIEVVNTALDAVTSYTLLDFADEIVSEEPDAVLLYAGHNEYYGALGVASTQSLGRFRPVVRLSLRLRDLRVLQGLRALTVELGGLFAERRRGEAPRRTLMERLVDEQSIPYGSPLYQRGLEQLRANLRELLERYRAGGIPVFVGTVASNERDQAPFISGLRPETDTGAWKNARDRAREVAERGDVEAALDKLEALIRIDDLSADAFYTKARLLDAAGRHDEARAAYVGAKDRDLLRFRAPEQINEVIRDEVARAGATLVDVQAALRRASPDGIIGFSLMLEHLHPNIDGYFLIADAFYEALQAAQLIGRWEQPVPVEKARADVLVTAVDERVADYRIRRLKGGWPFQPPGVVDRSVEKARPANTIDELALDLLHRRRDWHDATTALLRHYDEEGELEAALHTARAIIQQEPYLPPPYAFAGDILMRLERHDEALAYFEAANERQASPGVLFMMASILLARRDHTGAITLLERCLALDPEHKDGLLELAGAYALTGQRDRARAAARRLLSLEPDHPEGRRLLAFLDGSG